MLDIIKRIKNAAGRHVLAMMMVLMLHGVPNGAKAMSFHDGSSSADDVEMGMPVQIYDGLQPKYETRAVWLTTIGGLDWPRTKASNESSIQRQKEELCHILDQYKRLNLNTVILQTRVRGSVIYPSAYEPWDDCLTGHPGKHPGYDPLAYCIEECHRRGMELHAWIVCIPLGKLQQQKRYGAEGIMRRNSSLCKTVGPEVFMLPNKVETANYIAALCREITEKYDVDGISLDYIRYPESSYKFTDGTKTSAQRRENITRIVRAVHDAVKPLKPWVKLSSSPIGKYRDLRRYSSFGWNCYDAVGQEPQNWLRDNLQDLLFPMMYFQGNHFYPFVFDWKENSYGHPVVPGLGIYFLDPREGKWDINLVRAEMHTCRMSDIGGMAFYRGRFLTNNCKGIFDVCEEEFFPYPALPPRMTWMEANDTIPAPHSLRYHDGTIQWEGDAPYYNIYGSNTWPVDCSRAENLLAIQVRGNSFDIAGRALTVHHYAVVASDRFGNESAAAQEAIAGTFRPKDLNVQRLINHDLKGQKKRKFKMPKKKKK